MDVKQSEYDVPVLPWKRLVVRALPWGFACGLGILFVLRCVSLYTLHTQHPSPEHWDTDAFRVKNINARPLYQLDEHLVDKSSGTIFAIGLENTTGIDITLTPTIAIMREGRGALHSSQITLGRKYFVPAHHVVSITLVHDDFCSAEEELQTCFDRYFKDASEIFIFDETRKYRIRVPIPAAPKSGSIIMNQ